MPSKLMKRPVTVSCHEVYDTGLMSGSTHGDVMSFITTFLKKKIVYVCVIVCMCRLYAGGDFAHVDSIRVGGVAMYISGEWRSLGGGVGGGGVSAIASAEGCMYVGGAFTSIVPQQGGAEVSAQYGARFCDADDSFNVRLEAIDAFESIGPIRVIVRAADQGVCNQGSCI